MCQFAEAEGPANFLTIFASNHGHSNSIPVHQLIRIGNFDLFDADIHALALQKVNQCQGFSAEVTAQGGVEPDIQTTGSGRLKNFLALRVVSVASSTVDMPRHAATFSATTGRYMGSLRRDLGLGLIFLGIR